MSVLAVVLYVALSIALLAIVPGGFVIAREALRRRRARLAVERLAAARALLDELHREPASRVARALSRRFDWRTVQATLEAALDEEARSVELCERLGLVAQWERQIRAGRAWNERAHAARMLGKIGLVSVCPALVRALADPHEDVTVRAAAAEAVAQIRDPRAIPILCEALGAQREAAAPCVAEALVGFGRASVGPLAGMLDDARAPARIWAARVLGRIGDPAATLPLVERLADAHAGARSAAAEALGRIGDPRSARALACTALGDPAPAVRAQAASALAHAGDDEAFGALVLALGDVDPATRSRAVEALAALAPSDRSAIERALFDPVAEVRRSAALALDRLGSVTGWANALAAEDAGTRAAARAALVAIGRAGLVEAIAAAASQQKDAGVQASLWGIVGEVGSPKHAALLARAGIEMAPPEARVPERDLQLATARRGARVEERLGAIRELASAGSAEAVAALSEAAVSDPSPEVRAAAARGLAENNDRWLAVPALVRALSDPSQEVVAEAARALGTASPERAPERRSSEMPVPERVSASRRTTGRLRLEDTARESAV
ncbi:HEAT repeat domain-containing protein [Polyangium aurulentum]|uniref:HEAT repeat domain-containing protein n=1 Tax=Polyangium aurulentum TaxID=2567896 RepID=UPI0010AE7105|nr:HEAT repeat domain-containing protein [Polyangium aurulentum]UQA57795.1 HEAT repeat domain-containing protein [Polyangium aurulentum]